MPKKTEPKDTQSTQPEQVQQVRISDIHPFKNHPFKVVDDALMQETVDSIMQFGVLNPTIIRPDPGGGYEMVAGHRRLHASGLAGKDTIPAIVRNLTDDEAVILLVDTNLQRENISPMERAQAYKMKMEALKHQGQRTDLHKEPTSCQVGEKSAWAIAKVSEDAHQSERQVHRYLRLTELVPEIQKKVDAKEIAFNPAVELSYLKPEEQKGVLDAMEYSQNTPSLSQAQRLKKLSREGKCTQDAMYKVMSEEKNEARLLFAGQHPHFLFSVEVVDQAGRHAHGEAATELRLDVLPQSGIIFNIGDSFTLGFCIRSHSSQ